MLTHDMPSHRRRFAPPMRRFALADGGVPPVKPKPPERHQVEESAPPWVTRLLESALACVIVLGLAWFLTTWYTNSSDIVTSMNSLVEMDAIRDEIRLLNTEADELTRAIGHEVDLEKKTLWNWRRMTLLQRRMNLERQLTEDLGREESLRNTARELQECQDMRLKIERAASL